LREFHWVTSYSEEEKIRGYIHTFADLLDWDEFHERMEAFKRRHLSAERGREILAGLLDRVFSIYVFHEKEAHHPTQASNIS